MASVGAGCDDMPPYVSIQNFTDDWGNELVSFALYFSKMDPYIKEQPNLKVRV